MPEPGAPQYLSDQLTLFQPGRADYPHLLQLAPKNFSPSGITAIRAGSDPSQNSGESACERKRGLHKFLSDSLTLGGGRGRGADYSRCPSNDILPQK